MFLTVSRTSCRMSMYVSVVISPATTTSPVVISVSQATRLSGSFVSAAARTASEIWSAILSGWPSVTDSDVKRNERAAMCAGGYRLFAGRAASHQGREELVERHPFEHSADAFRDRQLDSDPARQVPQDRS